MGGHYREGRRGRRGWQEGKKENKKEGKKEDKERQDGGWGEFWDWGLTIFKVFE